MDKELEELYRVSSDMLGITYEEYIKVIEHNEGLVNWRKREIQGEDGKIYYVEEYWKKYGRDSYNFKVKGPDGKYYEPEEYDKKYKLMRFSCRNAKGFKV